MQILKYLFFFLATMGLLDDAHSRELQFDCTIMVEMDNTKTLVYEGYETVVVPDLPKRKPASEPDFAVRVFPNLSDEIKRYSRIPFSFWVTPMKERRGKVLVELGAYRLNNFAQFKREVVVSSAREVGRVWERDGRHPLEINFSHTANKQLNVDLSCNPS